MQYYSPGYQPSTEQIMDDSRAYRNRWGGHFVHGNRHLTLAGGYAADNGHGLRTFRDGNIVVRDKRIVGTSRNFLKVLAETKTWWYCPGSTGAAIDAITIHPWRNFGADVQYDVKMENVTFSRFGPSTGCPSDTALVVVDPSQTEKKRCTSTHYFADLVVEDEEPMNRISGCWATDDDVYGMAIEDSDGSLAGPLNGGLPGFFVGPSDASVYPFANAGGTCFPTADGLADSCLSYCPGACLYTLSVRANNAPTTSDLVMIVTDSTTGILATDTWHKFTFNDGDDHMTRASFDGYYGAAIPSSSGTFDISFVDSATGQPAWPDYVEHYLEKQPECDLGQLPPAINLVQPAPTSSRCDQLVKNGNFENGNFEGWQQGNAHLALSSPGAGSSLHQLYVTQRANANEYASQWLDVSCLLAGVAYRLTASIKMEQNNILVTCSTTSDCPRAKIDMYDWDSFLQKRTLMGSVIIAYAAGAEVSSDGYYLMKGTFVVSYELSLANSAQLIFDQPANVNYYLDDVSISALPATSAPTPPPSTPPSGSPTGSPTILVPVVSTTPDPNPDPYPGVTEKFILPNPTTLSGSSYAFGSSTWHYSHLLPAGVTQANIGQLLHTSEWAAASGTPQFIKYEYDSSVGFNTLYFAQRNSGCDMVTSIKVYAFDSDPGDPTTMSSSDLGEPVYVLIDEDTGGKLKTRDNTLEEYFLNCKAIMGKYIVFETYGPLCYPGGRALLLGYQPGVTYFPTEAPTAFADVTNPFVLPDPEEVDGSQYQHNANFMPSKLVDGSFSLADLGTSANQGHEWAAQRGKQVVVYRYDEAVNFNTIYYAKRGAKCDKMERIRVWVFDDDPGPSTSIKSQGLQDSPVSTLDSLLGMTNGDINTYEYYLGVPLLTGKYIVFETHSDRGCNPGGRLLKLGYQPGATPFPTQSPTTLAQVQNEFVLLDPASVDGSARTHSDAFSWTKLIDDNEKFTLADVGTANNQGPGEWAAPRLKQVVVYRYDTSVNFNTVYFAQRSAACDKIQRIRVWAYEHDPGTAINIKNQGLSDAPDATLNSLLGMEGGDRKTYSYDLAVSVLTGKHIVFETYSELGCNPGGWLLKLGYKPGM